MNTAVNAAPPTTLHFNRCDFIAHDTTTLFLTGAFSTIFFNTEYCTATGPLKFLQSGANCLILSGHMGLTLLNGAQLYTGGTVGQNILTV